MPMSRWLAIAAIAVAAACGSNNGTGYGSNPPPAPPPPPPPPPPGGHSTTITVANNNFSPTPDTISAGTITFNWNSGATVHNVTWLSGTGTTDSGDKSGTETFSTTLAAGDYTYHCTHHVGMNGAIHVKP